MTARVLIFSGQDRREDFTRWSLAAAIVVAAHFGLVATYLLMPAPLPPGAPMAPAVIIDLAPVPVAPSSEDNMSGPQKSEEVAPPPEPMPQVEQQIETPPKIETPPSEIVVPMPEPKPVERPPEEVKKVEPKKVEHKPASKASTAAPRSEHRTADRPAAPMAGAESRRAVADWRSQVSARLQSVKRCPSGATGTGSSFVSFTLDRGGHVLAKSVVRGSGNAAFDHEALDMISRASPFPPAPAGQPTPVRLPVPINFTCR